MINKNFAKPMLFATLGYPGSGKTFFSRRFAKDLGLFHLNSDRLRLEMFPKPDHSPGEHAAVFRMMDFIAGELLRQGISVIYDANSTKRAYRARLKEIAKKNRADYILLWFKTPTELARKRVKKRSGLKSALMKIYHRAIDDSVILRIKAEEEAPDKREKPVVVEPVPYSLQKEVVTRHCDLKI